MSLVLRPRAGEPIAQPNLTSPLLQLPVELVDAIASHLPRPSQILASQSCRGLRNILCGGVLLPDHHLPAVLPLAEQAEFLLHLSRGNPGEWVCEECMELHPAYMHDTPAKPMSEGYLPCFFPGLGQRQDLNIHDSHGFKLNHRHVQLALKHARLATTESLDTTYLQRLLEPHHKRIRSRYTRKHLVDAKFSASPKVVDGRFLVKVTFDFRENYDVVHRKYLGMVVLCGHQHTTPADASDDGPEQSSGDTNNDAEATHPLNAFKNAVAAAFQAPGEEVSGRCAYCSTDFAVRACPGRVTVNAWKDFGPEGTTYYPYWRSHASKVFSVRTATRMDGSIREFYGDTA